MNSSLYHGQVRHSRYRPRRHAFRYRLFQFYLDLDELPEVLDRLWFCSSRRPAPVRFRRRDHLGPQELPLKAALKRKVRELGGPELEGRVCLLTNLRYFGYCFNPVSFYYCFDKADERVETIVAEVNNTPWGEQHCYVLHGEEPLGEAGMVRYGASKEMHVSPFMPMDIDYDWALSQPLQRLSIYMANYKDGERIFDAAMALDRLRQYLQGRLVLDGTH